MNVKQYDASALPAAARIDAAPPRAAVLFPLELTLKAAKESALVAYLVTALIYYLRGGPLGHVTNLAFLCVFLVLAFAGRRRVRLEAWQWAFVLACIFLVLGSIIGAAAREPLVLADLPRAVTWLLPVALLLLLVADPAPSLERVGVIAGSMGLIANLFVTIGFGNLDAEKGKIEISTSFLDVSSNELSFHWTVFGVSLLLLGQRLARRAGIGLLVLSVLHLSKAHLASLVVASGAGFLRRRWLRALLLLCVGVWLLHLAVASDFLERVPIPEVLVPALGRLRDMLLLVGKAILNETIPLDALGKAIGGARYDVYHAAWVLMVHGPFGYRAAEVARGLQGLDPHSNLIYLALREGWAVLTGYVVALVIGLKAVSPVGPGGRILVALACYMLVRTLFMTYDPVRVLAMLVLFAQFSLSDRSHGLSSQLDSGNGTLLRRMGPH